MRILLIILFLPFVAFSQKTIEKKINFSAITSMGIVSGESGIKPIFQFSGGATYNRYFTGLGIGYDPYRFNSIPVFADWRMGFGNKKLLFIYGNGGYNVPAFYSDNEPNIYDMEKIRGGLYIDGGIGYRVSVGGLHRISFSAGYNQKNITLTKRYANPCLIPPCPKTTDNYHYVLGRIVTRLSWEIGK